MLDILRRQREIILPTPDVLHARSSIGTSEVIVNDQKLELHHFENKIDSRPVDVSDTYFRDGELAGTRHRFDTITDGGIDRGVSVYIPLDDIDKDYRYSVLMDTAWFTGLEGHNDRIAEVLMKKLGVPVVLVGPEFSSFGPEFIDAETNLKAIGELSTGLSLSMSAEASANIYAHLREGYPRLGLDEHVLGVGESRAAMIDELRRVFLEINGLNPVGSDITDPNLPKQAFTSVLDSLKLVKWPVRELIGATAVGISHAAHGELGRLNGTIPLDLRYLTGAIIGTGPALFSGEEGRGAQFTDFEYPQHILNFKGSGAAQTSIRREQYKDHYNTKMIERRGCHLSLGYHSVLSHLLARETTFGEIWQPDASGLTRVDIAMIHGSKPDKGLDKAIQLEKAA